MNTLMIPSSNRQVVSRRLFDNLFTNWDRAFFEGDNEYWRRQDNVVKSNESEDSYEHYLPLAGFKKENVKATVLNSEVYITAEKDGSTASYSFLVPEDADPTSLSARLEDGLLTIKSQKKESAKKIELEIS